MSDDKIAEAAKRVAEYEYDITKYPILHSAKQQPNTLTITLEELEGMKIPPLGMSVSTQQQYRSGYNEAIDNLISRIHKGE